MAIPSRVLHILAGLPSGRLTKWFVIVAWLALGLLVGPLARQLPGVERNDASALGPGAAESTQVRDLLAKATKRQQLPAVAVYVRTGGLTAADRAKVARDRWALAGLGLGRQVEAPVEAGDGEAMLLNVPLDGTDANPSLPVDAIGLPFAAPRHTRGSHRPLQRRRNRTEAIRRGGLTTR